MNQVETSILLKLYVHILKTEVAQVRKRLMNGEELSHELFREVFNTLNSMQDDAEKISASKA